PPPGSTLFPYTTLFRSLERLVDRMRLVRSLRLDHRRRHDPLPKDRRVGTAALPAEGAPGLSGRGPWIEIRWDPVLEDCLERGARSEEHTSELQSRFDLV